MDNTIITPLDGIKPRPFTDREASIKLINKVALLVFLYIVLLIYPAYGLLRSFWIPDFPIIELKGTVTTILIGGLFALFLRRSATNRVVKQVEAIEKQS